MSLPMFTEDGRQVTASEARAAGASFDDIMGMACALARSDKDAARRVLLWKADCAARVLHIYEQTSTNEGPRKAIIAARQHARSEIESAVWDAAEADAREAAKDAERQVHLHVRDTPDAEWFDMLAAWLAAKAMLGDDDDDDRNVILALRFERPNTDTAANEEKKGGFLSRFIANGPFASRNPRGVAEQKGRDWIFERLIARLSDNEPEDWPLPGRVER